MTTIEGAAGVTAPVAAAAGGEDEDALPTLEFMRGYLAACPHPDIIDATMRRWIDKLMRENALMRQSLAEVEPTRGKGGLSHREMQVYHYLRNTMMSQPEIALALYVSINTVKTHAKHIYDKLDVSRRAELQRYPAKL